MGGGGGDNGMSMMMMMLQQQQMQQQMEAQKAEARRQAFMSAQRGENQNYQRYQDLLSTQNKKVGDEWDLYNQNMDKILAIDPTYNAHQKYQFNPYGQNNQYARSTDENSANENQDLLNKWYGDLDKQSLNDFNQAKSQYEASKTWLTDAQNNKDAASRIVPGALPGAWGAGGGNVSGGAGADTKENQAANAGTAIGGAGANDVFTGFGSAGTAAPQAAGTGMIGGAGGAKNDNSLASVFVGATNPSKANTAGSTIF